MLDIPLVKSLDRIVPNRFGVTLPGYYLTFTIAVIFAVVLLLLPYLALYRRPTMERGFLIVDDLDRCLPDQMVEIIESVQLLLDEPEIAKRLQVCMLVDESALAHALVKKYEALTTDHCGPGHKFSAHRIVRENMEKFFQVHLRLPPATEEELKELVGRFTESPPDTQAFLSSDDEELNAQLEARDAQFLSHIADMDLGVQQSATLSPDLNGGSLNPKKHMMETAKFSDDERLALLGLVHEFRNNRSFSTWGPRSIRRLIFRYQLARELLLALGEDDFKPEDLWSCLIHPPESDYPFLTDKRPNISNRRSLAAGGVA